jgi:hypothetical protein
MTTLLNVGVPVRSTVATFGSIGTGTTVLDEVEVDVYGSVGWDVTFRDNSTGDRGRFSITAVHNGTNAVDASNTAFEISGQALLPALTNQFTFSTTLNGTGAAQVMRLNCTVTAGTWLVDVGRSSHVGSPL